MSARRKNAKQILDELRWRADRSLADAVIFYVHRGAPGDAMSISGAEIIEMDASFFTTADASVPYHRIFRIIHRGDVLLDRTRR